MIQDNTVPYLNTEERKNVELLLTMRSIKRIEDLNKNYMNKKLGCLNVGILSLATMQSRNSHWEGEQKVCNATLTPRGVILALLTNGVRDIGSVSSQVCFSSR